MLPRNTLSAQILVGGVLSIASALPAQATVVQFPAIAPVGTGANQLPRTYFFPTVGVGLSPFDVVAGDVDGDVDPDIFALNGLRLFINGVPDPTAGNIVESIPSPAFGTFTDFTFGAGGVQRVDQIANNVMDGFLADMDLDGDPDLVFCTAPIGGGDVLMLINTRLTAAVPPLVGPLRFRDARVPAQGWTMPFTPAPVAINAVVPVDIDLDGDTDVVAGTSAGLLLYTNNILPGAVRSFTIAALGGAFAGDVRGLVAANLDGAGALDIAAAVMTALPPFNFTDTVFLSSAGFAATALATPVGNGALGTSIRAGDVDGNGSVDLVIGHMPTLFEAGSDVVYTNNGAGAFTATALLPQLGGLAITPGTGDIELADLDEDGDRDVVATSDLILNGARTRLFLNNGAGAFTLSLGRISDDSNNFSFALTSADIDLDLDLDIVIGYFASTQLGLFPNHLWQHDGDRTIPAAGGPLTIDTFASAGFASAGAGQTFVTIAPPVRPFAPGAFGFVAIDPTWSPLNILTHATPSGTVQQVVTIPPMPPGLLFWMQSMLFDGTVIRASNITETIIQ